MHGSRDGSISYTRKKSWALSTGRRGEPCTGGLGSSISDLRCLFDDCSRWASLRSAEDDLQLITTSLFTSESDPLTANTLFSKSLFQWSLPISWCPPIADVTAIHCAQTLLVVPGVFAEEALGNGLSESSQSLPSVSVHAKLPSSESILSVSIDFVFAHLNFLSKVFSSSLYEFFESPRTVFCSYLPPLPTLPQFSSYPPPTHVGVINKEKPPRSDRTAHMFLVVGSSTKVVSLSGLHY